MGIFFPIWEKSTSLFLHKRPNIREIKVTYPLHYNNQFYTS